MNDTKTMQIRDAGPSHPRSKPLLRGYLHLSAAIAAAVGTGILLYLASGDAHKQVTLAIYGISSVILFGWSALYHIPFWSERVRPFLRRVDHANIFLLIAGTYTPIVHNLLKDGWRLGILTAAWVVAGLGVALAALAARVPRWVMAGLYVLAGWIIVIAMPRIVEAVSTGGLGLLLAAGVTYTLGAVGYASKRPRLWPRVFGYHEAFHLATIAANATFFAFMVIYVVPARNA